MSMSVAETIATTYKSFRKQTVPRQEFVLCNYACSSVLTLENSRKLEGLRHMIHASHYSCSPLTCH
jgi:hypothetical protein